MQPVPAAGAADTLLDALLRADAVDAAEVIEGALERGVDPIGLLDDVITPAMHEVGRLWELGTIGVGEEHLASSVAARVLNRLAPLLITTPPRSGPRVLMAAAQGERHVLALHMANDVMEGAGYAVKYAGADVPTQSLLALAERDRPALVAMTCTGSWAPAADIRDAISRLIAAQPAVGVLLGGAGWQGFELAAGERIVFVENMRDLLPKAERMTASA